MIIEFRTVSTHDFSHGGIFFIAFVDDVYRRCFVSDEALDDYFEGEYAKTTDARKALFEKHRDKFEARARAHIERGDEGDIVLATEDFASNGHHRN
jgi:hypothetical protein